jgi:hypothetical protein
MKICITYKSRASKFFHRHYILPSLVFQDSTLKLEFMKKKTPIIQASNDLWSPQDFEPQQSQG